MVFLHVCASSVASHPLSLSFSPSLYRSGPEENARLAEEVYQRLNAHKADNPSMGEVRGHQRLTTSRNTQHFFTVLIVPCLLGSK